MWVKIVAQKSTPKCGASWKIRIASVNQGRSSVNSVEYFAKEGKKARWVHTPRTCVSSACLPSPTELC
jgi:hypothetical protein